MFLQRFARATLLVRADRKKPGARLAESEGAWSSRPMRKKLGDLLANHAYTLPAALFLAVSAATVSDWAETLRAWEHFQILWTFLAGLAVGSAYDRVLKHFEAKAGANARKHEVLAQEMRRSIAEFRLALDPRTRHEISVEEVRSRGFLVGRKLKELGIQHPLGRRESQEDILETALAYYSALLPYIEIGDIEGARTHSEFIRIPANRSH